MSSPPWEADRPQRVRVVRAVARASLPTADLTSLEWIGSGWDFDAYRTADDWVIRFPRRAETVALFSREAPILGLARRALPSSVTVPDVEVVDHAVSAFPYPVAVHRLVQGAPADAVEAKLRASLARSLGAALSALHSVSLERARAAGLAELDREEAGRRDWLSRGSDGVRALHEAEGVLADAVAWLGAVQDPLKRLRAPITFIHHDLSPEHLLVDPISGRLSGIIDWTDAVLGDPARDFVPLVAFGGWGFARQVLEHYSRGTDPGFEDRLTFMARLLPLMWLGHAHQREEDVTRHVAWVRNGFADEG